MGERRKIPQHTLNVKLPKGKKNLKPSRDEKEVTKKWKIWFISHFQTATMNASRKCIGIFKNLKERAWNFFIHPNCHSDTKTNAEKDRWSEGNKTRW